jgi:hypothetical protein
LRRIFGLKRDEMTGKLQSQEFHDLDSSPHIIRMIKSRRMSPLGRPRHWWMDNIKMDLGEIG